MTKMHDVLTHGQSIWLDNISHALIHSGELAQLVNDGLRGITSNPSIFEKAIASSTDYDNRIQALAADGVTADIDIYEALAIEDIQNAADLLRPVYDASDGADGLVSLEVNPHLAHDTQGTIDEVHRLRPRVNRPNVMFKIPATQAGVVAVQQLIGEGININITLMFSLAHYDAVVEAYIKGLETLAAAGGDVTSVASVASVFVSRIDAKVDPLVAEKGHPELGGKLAVANSKVIYQRFKTLFSGARWEALAAKGARVQRPLWASTSTKNPTYPDLLYVDTLIGAHTVNTLPAPTLVAFMDHGTIATTVEDGAAEAKAQIDQAASAGVDLIAVGEVLQQEGAAAFDKAFDGLLKSIHEKAQQLAV